MNKEKNEYLKKICNRCPRRVDNYKKCTILTCECEFTIASKAWDAGYKSGLMVKDKDKIYE